MGGECVICGYNRCLRALHFHHKNPHEKDFDISSRTRWNDIEVELEKCILVCSNCHMEIHDGIIDHETALFLAEERKE